MLQGFTKPQRFADTDWSAIPNEPGVYVIFDLEETVYVGMAGRNGNGGLRNRLRDHSTGQIVNMFAQYLFLAGCSISTSPGSHTLARPSWLAGIISRSAVRSPLRR